MAKTVVVKLTDDLDGGDADETVFFGLDGKTYEIDLSSANAGALRSELNKYVAKSRSVERANRERARRPQLERPERDTPTLFSQLDVEEKDRFRKWADMPTARRIADARVQAWIDAGRP
jgi:hypothetical protein